MNTYLLSRIDLASKQWLSGDLVANHSATSFILPISVDENGFIYNRNQLDPCTRQSAKNHSYLLEFDFQRQPIPAATTMLVSGIQKYVKDLVLLSVDHRPFLLIKTTTKQKSSLSFYRLNAVVRALWPEYKDPIILCTSDQPFTAEGILENSMVSIHCRGESDKLDYDSYRYHSHFRPLPACSYYIPSCHAVASNQHDFYLNYSKESYIDWIRTSIFWSYLYHYPSGFAAVQIAGLEDHVQHLVHEISSCELPHLVCETVNGFRPELQKGLTTCENTAVVIHAFYPESLPAIFSLAKPANDVVDYLITTTANKASDVAAHLENHNINSYKIFIVENRGRDVAPFINVLLPALVEYKYDHFIKIHTKRSPHLNDGADWGSHLLSSLISDRGIRYVRHHFAQDNQTGLLSPPGSIIPLSACLNRNALWLAEILAAYGISTKWALERHFIAGSMFAGKVKPLMPLTIKAPTLDSYEPELGQVDATLAHAMERFISIFIASQNYHIEQIPGDSAAAPAFGYQLSKPTSISKSLEQLMQMKQLSL
jgi:hypothetical protein